MSRGMRRAVRRKSTKSHGENAGGVDSKKKEGRDALYQNDVAHDAIQKLEHALEDDKHLFERATEEEEGTWAARLSWNC